MKCPECSKSFKDELAVNNHRQAKHGLKVANKKKKQAVAKGSSSPDSTVSVAAEAAISALRCEFDAQLQKIIHEQQHTATELRAALEEARTSLKDVRSELESLRKDNNMLRQLLFPQFLAPLPPLTEQNIEEWCCSAKASEDEDRDASRKAEIVGRALGRGYYGYYTSYGDPIVDEVVIGGSLAKKTHVKGRFDADIVVFVRDFKPEEIEAYKRWAQRLITHRAREATFVRDTPAGSAYTVGAFKCDVLFTGKPPPKCGPICYGDVATRFYMASLTKNQVDYVTKHAGPVEVDVIRGIKKWIKTSHWGDTRPPSSYLLEVVVIHCSREWVKPQPKLAGKPLPVSPYNKKRLFQRVLTQLAELSCAEIQCEGQVVPKAISKPFVLDPINASNNLLTGFPVELFSWLVGRHEQ